jgi:hypothetical protein
MPWLLVTATNLGRNTARGTRSDCQFLGRLPRAQDQPDVAEVALDTHALGVDARLRAGLRALNKTDAHLFVLVALEGYTRAAQHHGHRHPRRSLASGSRVDVPQLRVTVTGGGVRVALRVE